MANLAIAGVVDEEAKKEFMKIENPNMTKIRKAAVVSCQDCSLYTPLLLASHARART